MAADIAGFRDFDSQAVLTRAVKDTLHSEDAGAEAQEPFVDSDRLGRWRALCSVCVR